MEGEPKKKSAIQVVKEIKPRTRRVYTAEEKIKIVLEGMRGEDTITAICREQGIHANNYFNWSKEFIEAGKRRLSGDNNYRYHESLNNLTLAAVYFGKALKILKERRRIKGKTMKDRRKRYIQYNLASIMNNI